jgi:hypothetical protein
MNIGTGIAVCGMWAAIAFITWTYRKELTPFGAIVCLAIGVYATAVLAGAKP